MKLVGRLRERQALDGLLASVGGGVSAALVLRGEPGEGKTALLDYAADRAAGMQVVRIVGIESEMELGFAGLHQMMSPYLSRLGHLPARQRDALASAFGLAEAEVADEFLVGLATLTLLSEVAEETAIAVVVDDAQWLDQPTAKVLGFVARRLSVDAIGFVFAVREPDGRANLLRGLPHIQLTGLPEPEARQLLARSAPAPVEQSVATRIIGASGGNPLALLDLASELTADQLAGRQDLPEPVPVGGTLTARFRSRISGLPQDTQQLLLLAAADPTCQPALLWRAATSLNLGAEALAPAERAQVVSIEVLVTFRHPLLRSAIYHGAAVPERRRAHAALAAATDPHRDFERRSWHLAQAAAGPDDQVAAALERSADRFRRRGAYATAGAYLARSAELSTDIHQQAGRLLAAAEAKITAGAPDRAQELLDLAADQATDDHQRAQARRLTGSVRLAESQHAEASAILLQAATELEPADPTLARYTLLEAMEAAVYAGWAGRVDPRPIARAARDISVIGAARPSDLLLDGLAATVLDGPTLAAPLLRRAVSCFCTGEATSDQVLRWAALACFAAIELLDNSAMADLASRWAHLARERAALSSLPSALGWQSTAFLWAGQLEGAELNVREIDELAEATGHPVAIPGRILLNAWRGQAPATRAAAETLVAETKGRGLGDNAAYASYVLTILELGLGHYRAAHASSQRLLQENPLVLGAIATADAVEAAARGDKRGSAATALARLRQRALASGTPWARGLLARSEAVMADDNTAECLYRDAVDFLEKAGVVPDLARSHLLYGEWLRRQGRRRDARTQFRAAYEQFQLIAADAFAERARAELLATGERARKRTVSARNELTPQEARIVALVASGESNQQVAAELFISAHTVDYHLRKVFRKVGVSSRTQLARSWLEEHPRQAPRTGPATRSLAP